jgi:hypothetical protein
VLYSSSDGRIVSTRATVESNGDVDGRKSTIHRYRETTRTEIELVEQNGYKTKQRERDKMVDLVAMAG